jgi:hypothetical protein
VSDRLVALPGKKGFIESSRAAVGQFSLPT